MQAGDSVSHTLAPARPTAHAQADPGPDSANGPECWEQAVALSWPLLREVGSGGQLPDRPLQDGHYRSPTFASSSGCSSTLASSARDCFTAWRILPGQLLRKETLYLRQAPPPADAPGRGLGPGLAEGVGGSPANPHIASILSGLRSTRVTGLSGVGGGWGPLELLLVTLPFEATLLCPLRGHQSGEHSSGCPGACWEGRDRARRSTAAPSLKQEHVKLPPGGDHARR